MTAQTPDRAEARKPATTTGYSDDSGDRIRAFLAQVRPLDGIAGASDAPKFQSGRSLIERMALTAKGLGHPTLRLTPAECSDVLHFLAMTEAVEPRNWWRESESEPSHLVGFKIVIETLEASLSQGSPHTIDVTPSQSSALPSLGEGHELALDMFDHLRVSADEETAVGEQCNLDPEYRHGEAYENTVLKYLQQARELGPEVERGFTMILSDLIGQVVNGGCPDVDYYEGLIERGIIAARPERSTGN